MSPDCALFERFKLDWFRPDFNKLKSFNTLEMLKSHFNHLLYDVCAYTGILLNHVILFLKQKSVES